MSTVLAPVARRARSTRGLDALALAALLIVVILALLAAWPAIGSADVRSYTVRGERVAIYNLAGTLTAVAAPGRETIVDVNRQGADAGRLDVSTGEIRGRQTLRVIYPGHRIVYPPLHRGGRTTLHVHSDGTFGDSHVTDWLGASSVTIAGSGDGLEVHADLRVQVPSGQTIELHLATGVVHVTNVEARLSVDVAAADVTTSGTRGALAIDAGSGDAEVRDATGPVSIDTGSGDIRVTGTRDGDVAIDAGSGSVEARDLDAERVSIDTGSGEVTVASTRTKRMAIDAGSGSIHLDLASDIDDLSIDSGSGDTDVKVPHDLGARLSLETGSGGFDVDLPISHLHRDQGEMSGIVGDGHGKIVIETGSGTISLHAR